MKAILRKLLPSSTFEQLQKYRAKVDFSLAKLCAKSKFSSSLFYFFISGQFGREHQSVLQGRIAYHESLIAIKESSALLRRNIHRIEKGLIMEPRKPSFGEAYISETVSIFSQCLTKEGFNKEELDWASDVLTEYFDTVIDTTVIKPAREQFNQLPVSLSRSVSTTSANRPYLSSERATSSVSEAALHDLFKQRRSTRWYQEKPVEMALIEQALDMATQAPSACNRQPFEFFTSVDPAIASEIASIPMGTKGFSQNIQAIAVVMGDLSAYPYERDRHVIYIDSGLVSMQFMLALETLGLSSCPINWPDIEQYEQQLSTRLKLPPYKRPIMMIAIGYAKDDGGIPYSQKKSASQLIKVID